MFGSARKGERPTGAEINASATQAPALVIVRGCAYHYNLHRFGLTNARRFDARIEEQQAWALRSLVPYVLDSMWWSGWKPQLAVDISNCSWPVTVAGVSGQGYGRLIKEAQTLFRVSHGGTWRVRPQAASTLTPDMLAGLREQMGLYHSMVRATR